MEELVKEIMNKLQAPFPLVDIEFRIGSTAQDKTRGMALPYITNRAIQSRLDDVFGPFGWRNEFKEYREKGVLCGISVKIDNEWITKWDGADSTDFEPTKGGLSDSMKRCAVQWGIGRYLYKLDAQWVRIKQQGKGFALDEIPRLPNWALPIQEHHNTNPVLPAQVTPQMSLVPPVEQKRTQAPITPAPVKSNNINDDYYEDEEYIKTKASDTPPIQINQNTLKENQKFKCEGHGCTKEISYKVMDYSKRNFGGKTLCMNCQSAPSQAHG